MTNVFNIDKLRARLNEIRITSNGGGPIVRRALTRAGALLANEVRIKLRESGLRRRTGDLANSIDFKIEVEGEQVVLRVGSFGVRYAFVHEFGGVYNIPQHSRTSRLGNIHSVRAHSRLYKARPFVRPAVIRQAENVARILQEELEK